ncbi:TOBE domain-containing protein [Jatrophihabitans sp.]|uniref:TOBE domain-containing protein n=1 Tax=Jatrophihabitans sp. TaxID=1932789 RepID=UPI0030C691A1|nr:modA [Jatrophihabitans sp.]
MAAYRIREAAQLLAVSDDTLRRWIDAGRVTAAQDGAGPLSIEGSELARFAEEHAASTPRLSPLTTRESARNHFVGLVTKVTRDTVMAQVELQSGPNRIVSLMSREAADELGLEPGVLAVASIKSTNVVIEVPDRT